MIKMFTASHHLWGLNLCAKEIARKKLPSILQPAIIIYDDNKNYERPRSGFLSRRHFR